MISIFGRLDSMLRDAVLPVSATLGVLWLIRRLKSRPPH